MSATDHTWRFFRADDEEGEKIAAAAQPLGADTAAAWEAMQAVAAKPPAPVPFDVGKFAGIFAAIGLAFVAH